MPDKFPAESARPHQKSHFQYTSFQDETLQRVSAPTQADEKLFQNFQSFTTRQKKPCKAASPHAVSRFFVSIWQNNWRSLVAEECTIYEALFGSNVRLSTCSQRRNSRGPGSPFFFRKKKHQRSVEDQQTASAEITWVLLRPKSCISLFCSEKKTEENEESKNTNLKFRESSVIELSFGTKVLVCVSEKFSVLRAN